MKRIAVVLAFTLTLGITLGAVGTRYLDAQQPALKRTELLRTAMAEMEGKEAHIWIADIAPGAATGSHRHPTTRFVYVVAGAVVLELEGQPPRTYRAGEAFAERPDVPHNFRNASTTESATALGFQIAGKGQPLQH
jgi:quercetin dioxygenase-like cupin family protein